MGRLPDNRAPCRGNAALFGPLCRPDRHHPLHWRSRSRRRGTPPGSAGAFKARHGPLAATRAGTAGRDVLAHRRWLVAGDGPRRREPVLIPFVRRRATSALDQLCGGSSPAIGDHAVAAVPLGLVEGSVGALERGVQLLLLVGP